MRYRKIFYNLINIIFILISALLINYAGLLNMHFSIKQLIILIILLIIIHVLKFIKVYFILLEENITFKKIIKIYIKSTFVSTILPYKSGELFKMYLYGYETKNYYKGIILVLIDKFFDAIVLCCILIPFGLINNTVISTLTYILLVFLIIVLGVYFSFENTYYYLNRYLIVRKKDKKSLVLLRILENMNDIYNSAKYMLNGRGLILLVLTVFTWAVESIFIYVMSSFMNMKITFATVINYISDSFFDINNILFNNYIYLCVATFSVIMIYIYIKKLIRGGRK